MKALFICTILFVLIPALSTSTTDLEARIVQGYDCDVKKYPFLVYLLQKVPDTGFSACGGNIITLDWVLTAGHCVNALSVKSGNLQILAGSNYPLKTGDRTIPKGTTSQLRTASKVKFHEEWEKGEKSEFDIAVLKMNEPFTLTSTVSPAILPYAGFTKQCRNPKAMGWGRTSEESDQGVEGRHLKCADLSFGEIECWRYSRFGDGHICAIKTDSAKTGKVCYGDSGGPLVCDNPIHCASDKTPKSIIVGIAHAVSSCKVRTPAIFVRVERHMQWFRKEAGIVFPNGTGPGGRGMEGYLDYNSGRKAVGDTILLSFILGIIFV